MLAEEYFDGVEVITEPFGNDAVLAEVVDRIADLQTRCDGILYSRKDPYLLVSGELNHTVPVRYVETDASHLLISLLAAIARYGALPPEISIDSFDARSASSALAGVGLGPNRVTVHSVSVDAGRPGLVDATLQQHMNHLEAGAELIVTNITDVHHTFKERGVPATLISPSPESFAHEIRNLMLRHQLRSQREGGLAIVHIRLQYKDRYRYHGAMPIREVDDLSAAGKLIAVFAEEVDSAMFQLSRWDFVILCSRQLLESVTGNFANIALMNEINTETAFDVAIGIGAGQTVKEAEANSLRAISETRSLVGTYTNVVIGQGTSTGPIKPRSHHHPVESAAELDVDEMARRTGLSTQVLGRLHEVARARSTQLFTSAQLASHLGVSQRTVNRIVAKLLSAGLAAVEGKDLTQEFGRPARVIRLRL